MYQVVIKPNPKNPDRYLPPSWNIDARDDESAMTQAIRLCEDENVELVKIVNDKGREIKCF